MCLPISGGETAFNYQFIIFFGVKALVSPFQQEEGLSRCLFRILCSANFLLHLYLELHPAAVPGAAGGHQVPQHQLVLGQPAPAKVSKVPPFNIDTFGKSILQFTTLLFQMFYAHICPYLLSKIRASINNFSSYFNSQKRQQSLIA